MINARCVVIGGGTGSFTVLNSLKNNISDIYALVNMADDGGSTGLLRDELGVLPPGDVRQCLVALSDAPKRLRDLFNFRFEEGSLKGHSFGNLFLSAVEKMTDDFGDAVALASEVLDIRGKVIPITLDNVRLIMEWADGTSIHGEGRIDIAKFMANKGLPTLRLEPSAHINPSAAKAIAKADIVIIAPGDLYTSVGPLLTVDGVREALAQSKAKKIYISNLVQKPGQTAGFTVGDHAAEIERFAGPILDYVLYNTARPDTTLLDRYKVTGEILVSPDEVRMKKEHYTAIGSPLLSNAEVKAEKGDALAATRSFIRHDGAALWQAIQSLI